MTELRELGEEGLIRILATTFRSEAGNLLVGPGDDDAAAWREPAGFLVASLDTMAEGVHFEFAWLRPQEVGWRALAMAVNDLAAKGAQPLYGLVSMAAPGDFDARRAVGIAEGIARMAESCGLVVAGGDLTSTSGPVIITVSVLGRAEVPPVPRSAARPGWLVAVTGRLGAAAAGLQAVRAGAPLEPAWEEALRRPRPRLEEGRRLTAAGLCSGDVSDGLHRELVKFRAMARVGSRLDLGAIPLAPGVDAKTALGSGEEVELVCTAPPEVMRRAVDRWPDLLTIVGELTDGDRVVVLGPDGEEIDVGEVGHRHFA